MYGLCEFASHFALLGPPALLALFLNCFHCTIPRSANVDVGYHGVCYLLGKRGGEERRGEGERREKTHGLVGESDDDDDDDVIDTK